MTEPEYPEFAWKEIIVNAIAHRDYSIKGTDIQIKMFDDHITVESPGTLPGTVRLNNMREIHFSRNPKCQTAHCGRGKPHFNFGEYTSQIVPYRHLPQILGEMTADYRSLV